jgi:DUF1680 family protein
MQAHVPVRDQPEVTGHAVRAMYLYSAMADLANETGDADLLADCERWWEDLCLKRMYVTGGIGPSASNEGFTTPYDLPAETAYAETCAAVGLVLWNHRMLQFDGIGKYADVVERALYNGTIAGCRWMAGASSMKIHLRVGAIIIAKVGLIVPAVHPTSRDW